MELDFTLYKYGRYKRKSSDEKDKQAQSLETQDRELETVQETNQLKIVREWRESKTAFVPGRPLFAELVDATMRETINAWLVWHPTRLSRNPVDAGTVIYLMDIGKLHHVRTPNRVYQNTPTDKLLLGFELMISKKDSDDKSLFIRANIETKSKKGIPHSIAKIGYRNSKTAEKGLNYWLVDEENHPKIKRLFELFLTGSHSVTQLHKIARDEIRLRTPVRKNSGGLPVSRSRLYVLLSDPIYAGFFYYNSKRFELDARLPRAISEDQYWRVQTMLGRKGKPKPIKRKALYNKFMCDASGGGITPDFKFQLICPSCKHKFSYPNKERCPRCDIEIEKMKDPTYLSYVYYYSTKQKKTPGIRARGIEESIIEKSLMQYYYRKIVISPELSQWLIDNIPLVETETKIKDRETIQSLKAAEGDLRRKLERLLDLQLSKDNLDSEQAASYEEKERKLRAELAEVREKLQQMASYEQWLPQIKNDFALLPKLIQTIENGLFNEKVEAYRRLGSNLTLIEGKISISNNKWVQTLMNGLEQARKENQKFEPRNTLANKDQTDVFASVCPTLRRTLDNVRTYWLEERRSE